MPPIAYHGHAYRGYGFSAGLSHEALNDREKRETETETAGVLERSQEAVR